MNTVNKILYALLFVTSILYKDKEIMLIAPNDNPFV